MGRHDKSFYLVRVRVYVDGVFRDWVDSFAFIPSNVTICEYTSGTVEGFLHSYSRAVRLVSTLLLYEHYQYSSRAFGRIHAVPGVFYTYEVLNGNVSFTANTTAATI